MVVGVPAKIIRYCYAPEQIEKLNAIAWWDWSDEKIRDCYDDFKHFELFSVRYG